MRVSVDSRVISQVAPTNETCKSVGFSFGQRHSFLIEMMLNGSPGTYKTLSTTKFLLTPSTVIGIETRPMPVTAVAPPTPRIRVFGGGDLKLVKTYSCPVTWDIAPESGIQSLEVAFEKSVGSTTLSKQSGIMSVELPGLWLNAL